jgi:hypothetical protein
MQGILLKPHPKGVALDLAASGQGLGLDFQNAYVHALTGRGTATFEPSRGTTLRDDIRSGQVRSLNGARHASNFAALSSMQNLRTATPPPGFSRLQILPVKFIDQRLELEMLALDAQGNPVTYTATAPA